MSQVLVEVTRGPIVESIHRGDIAVVDSEGRLLYRVGDPEKVTYMRSSAKPIQALSVVESGAADRFGFSDRELAVMCASHSAETIHVETVAGILDKIGLEEAALRCGVHMPIHEESRWQLIREGSDATPIHSNCSGKHSGMLAVCIHRGWSVEDYFKPEHPVQQLSLRNMADLADFPADDIIIGVDGCGVVVWGLPIRAMALAFARLADPSGLAPERRDAVRRIVAAVQKHPEMIAGTERFCSDLVEAMRPEVIAKSGAQGVYCLGHSRSALGVALKVEDGNSRGAYPSAVAALDQLNLASDTQLEELEGYYHPKNTNVREEIVGEIRPVFTLTRAEG